LVSSSEAKPNPAATTTKTIQSFNTTNFTASLPKILKHEYSTSQGGGNKNRYFTNLLKLTIIQSPNIGG
ncbi:MAG: hypothetical protein II565_03250, partial [Fibrobacter sp.]|nr:hypothetical protein [Fibrobacter sp.]